MRDIVRANLNAAVEGGYYVSLGELEPYEIVAELLAFAEDCQDATVPDLLPHVEEWAAERRAVVEALSKVAGMTKREIMLAAYGPVTA